MNRALKPTQDNNISPKKLSEGTASKGNSSPRRFTQCNGCSPKTNFLTKENMAPSSIGSDASVCFEDEKAERCDPQCTALKCLEVKTMDTPADPQGGTNQTSLTPRVARFEDETSNLLARLQASYKLSRDILQEIQLEKADLFDLSPLRTSKEGDESKRYEEVSAYCQGKQFTSSLHRGVELDVYEGISSYCAEKMVLLTSVTALDIITKERDDLLTENSDLRYQIEYKSSCYIQAQASIASMIRLLKEKEDALREYDEVLKMNDDANASIVGAMTHQHNDQIATLNKKLQKSRSNVRELEGKLEAMEKTWFKFKAMWKVKDRQLDSAFKMRADLETMEKENTELQMMLKTQSSHIDYLSSSNNEFIDIIASLTKMINEKDQAIHDWENFYRMNDEANKKLLEHAAMKHTEELQENAKRVTVLLNVVKRQRFGESEYFQLQLKEKVRLRLEVEAMRRRLDSYDYCDQAFSDAHLVIAVVCLSSGLLLLFWSNLISGHKNC